MRLDHVSYAAEPDGLTATAARLATKLGVNSVNGGVHPSFGTRNIILPLADGRYVEVVEALDHPAAEKAPFGQAVRACAATGGGWMGWVCRVDDITEAEARLGRESVPGHRVFPDGRDLRWRQIGVRGLINDPQLPFFVEYENPDLHPSLAVENPPQLRIVGLTIAGDPGRVREWVGLGDAPTSGDIEYTFVAPHGTAGLMSVEFSGPAGDLSV